MATAGDSEGGSSGDENERRVGGEEVNPPHQYNIYSEAFGVDSPSVLVDAGRADEEFNASGVRFNPGEEEGEGGGVEEGEGGKRLYEPEAEDDWECDEELGEDLQGKSGGKSQRVEGSTEEDDPDFNISKYMCTAFDLVEDYITSGCPEMDELMKGGFPAFGITELYGEAGTGKTQICLQLAILAQLPKERGGLDSGVLYICTEEGFPSPRLNELSFHLKKRFPSDLPANPMDNIYVEHLEGAEDLMECLDVKLDALARQSPRRIRLVVLDSVAGIFRNLKEDENWEERANGLRMLAQSLHEFSYDHKAAILVCNQVTADMKTGGNSAALGTAWRTLTTTRIRLSKFENIKQRRFEVVLSPHLPTSNISFVIEAEGVRGVRI